MTQPLNKGADDGVVAVTPGTASSRHDSTDSFGSRGSADHARVDDDRSSDGNSLDEYRMADSAGTVKGSGSLTTERPKSLGYYPPEADSLARFGFPAGLDIFDPDMEESATDNSGDNKSPDAGKTAAKPSSPEVAPVDKSSPESKGAANGPNLDGMAKWFEDNFDNLDKDKDGTISKTELDQGLLDPKLATGDGAVYLAAANDKTKDWTQHLGPKADGKESSDDDDKPASAHEEPAKPGITRESLTKLREVSKDQESKGNQEKLGISKLQNEMNNIEPDGGGDGCITKTELEEALKKDHWTKEQRESLENLKRKFSEVSKTTDDSEPPTFSGDSAYPGFQYGFGLEEEFVSKLDLEKYNGDESKFVDGLKESIKDKVENKESKYPIDQHGLDSCFLLAPLEALEKEQPGTMDKMIKDNEDGTVTVTFPGDPDNPVTIAKPTEGEQAEFTNGKAGIIEKAFADYVSKLPADKQKEFMERSRDDKPTLIQHQLDGGGMTEAVMNLLTGNEAVAQQVKPMSEQQLIDSLTAATENHQLITIGTNQYTGDSSGISPRHAYSVSFDPKTNTVTLTNPNKPNSRNAAEPTKPDHSPADGKSDGSFTLTMEQFKQYTDTLFIGTAKK